MQKPIENASDWRTDKFSASDVMKWTSTTRWIEQRGKRARGYPLTQSIKLCGDWKSRTQKRAISEKLHIRHLSRKTIYALSCRFYSSRLITLIELTSFGVCVVCQGAQTNIRTAVMSSGTLWFQFSCTQIKSTQRNEGNGRVQLWQKEFCERMKAMNNRTWIYSVLDFPQLYSAGRQHMRTVRVRTIAARETQCSYQLGRRSKGHLIYLIIHANHTKSAHLSFTFIIWLDGITLTVKR